MNPELGCAEETKLNELSPFITSKNAKIRSMFDENKKSLVDLQSSVYDHICLR